MTAFRGPKNPKHGLLDLIGRPHIRIKLVSVESELSSGLLACKVESGHLARFGLQRGRSSVENSTIP